MNTFEPINLSAFDNPIFNELASGEVRIEGTMFFEKIQQVTGPVLEIGCGDGRLTIPLAERGIDMTGVELSAPTIAYAREKAGDLPIEWIEGDARTFQIEKKFALIIARGDVINFMLTRDDQEAMLSKVSEHLAHDGIFMIDNAAILPYNMVNTLEETEWYRIVDPEGRNLYVAGTDYYDHDTQLYTQTCFHRLNDAEGELVAPPWELTLRYFMPKDLEALLHYNGFDVVERYASWDGEPATPEEPGSIFICRKRLAN